MAVAAGTVTGSHTMPLLRYLDVVAVVLAAAPAVVLGVPTLGFGIGAGAWLLQRLIHAQEHRLYSGIQEPRNLLAVRLFEAFGRIWLLAIAIVVAGVAGGRADGLTAAVTIFAAYSIAFVIRVLSGPPPPLRRTGSAAR